jgi:hypothetical protein
MTIYGVLMIMAIGLVFAGLMHSLWPMLTGRNVDLQLLFEPSPVFPLNALVVVTAAPLVLLQAGLMRLSVPGGVFAWWLAFILAMALCFVQGVVVVVSLDVVG